MSDSIKHECGIALIRLLKPLDYYHQKYGTALYGLNKLYLLMEKQHNRGQDGAGVATIKLDPRPGFRFISRERSNSNQPISDIFQKIYEPFHALEGKSKKRLDDPQWLKQNKRFMGEVLLGHLRYGTHGNNSIEQCHPVLRLNNWMTRNLVMAGNFNLTNVNDLFDQLIEIGQFPKEVSDTVTVLEKFGHFLDQENQRLFDHFNKQGYSNRDISQLIADNMNVTDIISRAVRDFDGGYTMSGLIGQGDAFAVRDPAGIRPAFYYHDDEVAVVASERPAIQTCFGVRAENVKELKPGHAFIIRKNGDVSEVQCNEPRERKACSFERIYFSRGTDKDIYKERKQLGKIMMPRVLEALDYDIDNTIFSFIPNTSEVAFYGLLEGVNEFLNKHKADRLKKLNGSLDDDAIDKILNQRARVEKLAIKDAKLRTFITEDKARDELVSHIYDITYGVVKQGTDTIVAVDDSIVRGTTLKKSILSIMDRLGPKKIIIVSSAPQIRYPDCYGIDMSKMGDFVAFRAAVQLHRDNGDEGKLKAIYNKCVEEEKKPLEQVTNQVKALYAPFTAEEISVKIAELLKPDNIFSDVQIIYQSLEGLHASCPDHLGDWYFSGDFPTAGGNKIVNRSFINFMEGKDTRAYS